MLLPGVFLKTCRGLYTGKEPLFRFWTAPPWTGDPHRLQAHPEQAIRFSAETGSA